MGILRFARKLSAYLFHTSAVDTIPIEDVTEEIDTIPIEAVTEEIDTIPIEAVTEEIDTIPIEAVTEEVPLPSTSTEHVEVMSSPMKTRKRNDMLLVKALRLQMKQQERKIATLKQENKHLTSVLCTRPMKRLKERIIQRDMKIIQLREELTPQCTTKGKISKLHL